MNAQPVPVMPVMTVDGARVGAVVKASREEFLRHDLLADFRCSNGRVRVCGVSLAPNRCVFKRVGKGVLPTSHLSVTVVSIGTKARRTLIFVPNKFIRRLPA
jgi:hypothetical protein